MRSCDPDAGRQRNDHMLELDPDPALEAPAPPVTVNAAAARPREREQVDRNRLSEQTQWMLAVRDNRDRAAFGRLFDYFAPRLKGVICRSGISQGQAEDIVQDVMLTVWRKAHLFDPQRAQVSSWIYQVARNRQIDVIRKERRPVPEELKQPEEVQEDASQIVALEQETTRLRDALKRLKPAQREMVEKAYFGELSHSDIRAETGLPLGTIKSRIRLGLERLRHELKGTDTT